MLAAHQQRRAADRVERGPQRAFVLLGLLRRGGPERLGQTKVVVAHPLSVIEAAQHVAGQLGPFVVAVRTE